MFALIKSVASLVAVRLLLALSKPVIPSENTPRPFDYCRYQSRCAFGGDVGGRTRVQNTFNCQFTTINQLETVALSVHSMISVALQDTSCIAQMSLHANQCNSQSDCVRMRMDIVSLQTYYTPNNRKR